VLDDLVREPQTHYPYFIKVMFFKQAPSPRSRSRPSNSDLQP
jgi:hypothetical protein